MQPPDGISERFGIVRALLDERSRRLMAAAESVVIGRGGIAMVSRATGLSRQVIRAGVAELQATDPPSARGVRRAGGGRKKTVAADPALLTDLDALLEPLVPGDLESSLRWTCKSLRKLADELKSKGHKTSHRMVGDLLLMLGYTLQAESKDRSAPINPDRNAQFIFLNEKVRCFSGLGLPFVMVNMNRSECARNAKDSTPKAGRLKDQRETREGGPKSGWLGTHIDRDTAGFASESIDRWWESMGRARHPKATELLILADLAGSAGVARGPWELGLQRLANSTGMRVSVCHLPPGTCKWGPVEHRLLSRSEEDVAGKSLVRLTVSVSLIGAAVADCAVPIYPVSATRLGVQSSAAGRKQPITRLDLRRDGFHGEWNYSINRALPAG